MSLQNCSASEPRTNDSVARARLYDRVDRFGDPIRGLCGMTDHFNEWGMFSDWRLA
jgi:hypothetical protein